MSDDGGLPGPPRRWSVVARHRWRDRAGRSALLVAVRDEWEMRAGRGRYFVVDGVEPGVLEVCACDDPARDVGGGREPAIFDPSLHPGRVAPPCLGALLASATAVVWDIDAPVGDPRGPIAAVYRGLLPADVRAAALRRGADWLASRAGTLRPQAVDLPAVVDLPTAQVAVWEAHRAALARDAAAAGRAGDVPPSEVAGAATARLAHVVAVLADLAGGDLAREAGWVAWLASEWRPDDA